MSVLHQNKISVYKLGNLEGQKMNRKNGIWNHLNQTAKQKDRGKSAVSSMHGPLVAMNHENRKVSETAAPGGKSSKIWKILIHRKTPGLDA